MTERGIFLRWTAVGEMEAEIVLSESEEVQMGMLKRVRRRLLRRKDSPISEVAFLRFDTDPPEYRLSATLGLYVPECRHFEGLGYFQAEVKKLTGKLYFLDCSTLGRKPASTRPPRRPKKSSPGTGD